MRSLTRCLPLLALLPLLACAPIRAEDSDPDPIPVNDFDTALFTIVDHGDGATHTDANLVLVDHDLECEDLRWNGELDVWSVPEGVSWVRLFITHGVALDGWLRDYEAFEYARVQGTDAGNQVAYFWGEYGEGPLEDEIPVDPPGDPEDQPAGGRDLIAGLGYDSGGMDDLLGVSLSTEVLLGGTIETWAGDWSFAANKCDVVEDQGNGTDPDEPPPQGTDDGDGGDSGDSGGSAGSP
jgi:hypothetical protein